MNHHKATTDHTHLPGKIAMSFAFFERPSARRERQVWQRRQGVVGWPMATEILLGIYLDHCLDHYFCKMQERVTAFLDHYTCDLCDSISDGNILYQGIIHDYVISMKVS